MLMPETSDNKALEAAERIRRQVEAMRLPTAKGPVSVTISLGVTTLVVGSTISLDQLIINADDALYAAKAAGRNRVQSFKPAKLAG